MSITYFQIFLKIMIIEGNFSLITTTHPYINLHNKVNAENKRWIPRDKTIPSGVLKHIPSGDKGKRSKTKSDYQLKIETSIPLH